MKERNPRGRGTEETAATGGAVGGAAGALGFGELPRKLRVFGIIMLLGESSPPRVSLSEALGLVGATIGEVTVPLVG